MNNLAILSGLATGALLGLLFFAGLWLTIKKGLVSRHPGVWFSLSLLLRIGAVVLVLTWTARQGFENLVSALTGFLVVRSILNNRIKHQIVQIKQGKEGPSSEDQS